MSHLIKLQGFSTFPFTITAMSSFSIPNFEMSSCTPGGLDQFLQDMSASKHLRV